MNSTFPGQSTQLQWHPLPLPTDKPSCSCPDLFNPVNSQINSLLGPLEAATRLQSWEDAEDIAREITRLCRVQRLVELQKIQEALWARGNTKVQPRPSWEEIRPFQHSVL